VPHKFEQFRLMLANRPALRVRERRVGRDENVIAVEAERVPPVFEIPQQAESGR
jgi:hypothetical protein